MADTLKEQIADELTKIDFVLTQMSLGGTNRWSGTVRIVETLAFKGKKGYDCAVEISSETARSAARWRTLIHELLHARSTGLNQKAYRQNRGWEEGTVENLQRLIRSRVLSELEAAPDEAAIAADEATFTFEQAVRDMESLRLEVCRLEGGSPEDADKAIQFYSDLLKHPLEERPLSIAYTAWRVTQNESQSFRRVYATVRRRLSSPD